jgi:hypothetical protein
MEAFLWLPDDIVSDLSSLLSDKDGAPEVRELIFRVRKLLSSKTNIEAWQVIIFTQAIKKKMSMSAVETLGV